MELEYIRRVMHQIRDQTASQHPGTAARITHFATKID
jgi:hypothetical protein